MKIRNIFNKSVNAFIIIIFAVFVFTGSAAKAQGSAYCVIDTDGNTVLDQENMHQKLEMASTTKIMTAIIVLENIPLEFTVRINRASTNVEGSSMYLKENDVYTVEDLLYGLMLVSGNDAAVALAYAVGGTVNNFVKMMNEKAIELGLKNTSFQNPHGLHHKEHYTTAYDLARLCAYAMKNDEFTRIVSSHSKKIIERRSGQVKIINNKNKFLDNFEGADGIKIGYTTNSGRCLCASATRNGKRLICVILNHRDWFEKAEYLLNKQF